MFLCMLLWCMILGEDKLQCQTMESVLLISTPCRMVAVTRKCC